MATLVTGATGLIGSWLVDALRARGDDVVALTRDPAGEPARSLAGRCVVVGGDVTDAGLLRSVVFDHAIDTVFHLAAQTIVGAARFAPAQTYAVNVTGTTAVLEAAREGRVRRAVVAGSVTAYGPRAAPPYTEDLPLAPTDPYDISKATADLMARSYWPAHGLPVATTRLGNVYGGGDRNASRLVPELIAAALDGRAPRIRSDGSPRCDFLHVEDAVAAYLAIADALDDPAAGARGEAFNAGSGQAVSVREVVEAVERVAGRDLGARYDPPDPDAGSPPCRYAATDKIERVCGWRPRIGLEEGLRRTLAWSSARRLWLF